MARKNSLDKMSYSELATLRTQIDGMMVEKQSCRARRIAPEAGRTWPRSTACRSKRCSARRRKGKGSVALQIS